MYFPYGWPRKLAAGSQLVQINCDRVKILFAVLSADALEVWYSNKPCVPIVTIKRSTKCVTRNGVSCAVEWKPDSTKLGVVTEGGTLLIYDMEFIETATGVFNQTDSPQANLRRDSAELFIKEKVPSLRLRVAAEVQLFVPITSIVCVTIAQLMIATKDGKIKRYNWSGVEERDFSLELNRVPFSVNQQVSSASPIFDPGIHVTSMDYSPLLGGFAVALNDGRAAFLTAPNLKFDPNQVQGIWAPGIDDASTVSINHKYRLIAVGRKNSQVSVFTIDDLTGGLELSHSNVLSSRDYPSNPGRVRHTKWTPDGSAVICSWEGGGFSVWSTFGSLLTCSLGWDFGLLSPSKSMEITSMDWSCEGYQLTMIRLVETKTELLQLDFVKSALSVNPCVSLNPFLLLQGDDKLFINHNETLETVYNQDVIPNAESAATDEDNYEIKAIHSTSFLSASKHWITILVPTAYTNANWPVRFSALDRDGNNLAVAGRTGVAIYSLVSRKWKLFGNESQEKDFVVTGGLVWWNEFLIMGAYSLTGQNDEIRVYSREEKLDNKFGKIFEIAAPVMLINIYEDQMIIFTADGHISIFCLMVGHGGDEKQLDLLRIQVYDIKNICMHPAFVVSLFLTNLKHDIVSKPQSKHEPAETIVLNVAGRVLMIQKEGSNGGELMTTCLASCVECIWFFVDFPAITKKLHLKESLWLFCGGLGMRVWLPVFPRDDGNHRQHRHTFMAKRIMLSFELKIYPLAISFEDAVIFGTENDTVLYMNDSSSHFALPFCTLKRTSQVYLHQILKQLIKRNLGYNAWEIARSCATLPYFPHSLELLLHEVLEQEATSKDPIPDALLPSVIEFIQEFPVYLQTIVQCARKTEIALWPYLFATAGKPKDLFQQCMANRQLYTATNYLIILQNLESSTISKQYATLLLDAALEQKNWSLSHDLVRFLKAIDPNDTDSPRNSFVLGGGKFSNPAPQPVIPDAEDLSLILSHMTPRTPRNSFAGKNYVRVDSRNMVEPRQSISEAVPRPASPTKPAKKSEDQFIDPILFKHLKNFLEQLDFQSLGYMSAALDIQLVAWLSKEKDKEKLPRIDDFVAALKKLHDILEWPKPVMNLKIVSAEELDTGAPDSPGLTAMRSNKESKDSGYSSINTPLVVAIGENDDTASVISEITSIWEEPETEAQPIIYLPPPQKSSKKLEVQMRYLLQIFTEANCLDFSLLLSVLLLDSTSVNRVCTAALRSSATLSICRQLKNGLTDLTRWSFNECLGYRAFMLSCGEDLKALERFVSAQESIPDFVQNVKVVRTSSAPLSETLSSSSSSSVRVIRGPHLEMPSTSPSSEHDMMAKKEATEKTKPDATNEQDGSSSSCAIM